MTTIQILARVKQKVKDCLVIANSHFPNNVDFPQLDFTLKGGVAGQAFRRNALRFNLYHLRYHTEEMINQTVPHEVAHLIVYANFPQAKPHGREWKEIMRLLGALPERCHSYSSDIRTKKWKYTCACNTIRFLSTRRHNQIQKNKDCWHCGNCKENLQFLGKIIC